LEKKKLHPNLKKEIENATYLGSSLPEASALGWGEDHAASAGERPHRCLPHPLQAPGEDPTVAPRLLAIGPPRRLPENLESDPGQKRKK